MMCRDWKNADAARRFMWAVQALAIGANEQERLFPEFVDTADELALEHEETQATFLEAVQPMLSPQQRESIQLLDQQLELMSGCENEQFWTAESLATAPEWERVRELAAAVLQQMGWPHERPPRDRSIYVGPPSESE